MGPVPEWLLAQRVPGYVPENEECGPVQQEETPEDKQTNSSIIVYPNPAGDIITVEGIHCQPFTVSILTADGTILITVQNQTDISVNDLSAGLYLVQVITGNDTFATNFLKGY
jgi:hypothetical protein